MTFRKVPPMTTVDLSAAVWRKSTRSSSEGNCVEIAPLTTAVAVRDSKNVPGPALAFPTPSWSAFLNTR
jgi:hypothetical protein